MFRWTRSFPPVPRSNESLNTPAISRWRRQPPAGVEAGDLLHAIDRVRQVDRERAEPRSQPRQRSKRTVMRPSEVESLPLEPGRSDVVRVMNLHKAKGTRSGLLSFWQIHAVASGRASTSGSFVTDADRAGLLQHYQRKNW
jgi:hypothetical protein